MNRFIVTYEGENKQRHLEGYKMNWSMGGGGWEERKEEKTGERWRPREEPVAQRSREHLAKNVCSDKVMGTSVICQEFF